MDTKTIVIAFAVILGLAAGAGFVAVSDGDGEETYYFYIDFGADDDRSGWYNADARNAGTGFDKAMNNAGFAWEKSSYGYIQSIDGCDNGAGWALYEYLYSECTEDAMNASIAYPKYDKWGAFIISNGWTPFSGYDGPDFKLGEAAGNVFYFTAYNADWSANNPVTNTAWMGQGPFSA